jgi:hypothetical protein
MKIGVAGSVGLDHLMTFSGKFTDSLVAGSLEKVSLSFLVDGLEVRRGGCAANIVFGMGVLGLNPILIAAVGIDWPDYDAWLVRHGVDTSHVWISKSLHTAHFMVTTDTELNQIASFFPGAMSEARNIELAPIMDKTGKLDLIVISPDDPEAMLRHTEVARQMGIAIAADPSQQMARMSGEEIKQLIDAQIERMQKVNSSTKEEIAAAILISSALEDDEDRSGMLKAALVAIFINLISKKQRVIAEHEAQTSYNAGVYFGAKQVGAASKTWISLKDTKTRAEHRLLDGKTVSVGDAFNVGDDVIRFPGDPLSPARMTMNCRCRLKFGLN